MRVLVVNAGSTSLKLDVLEGDRHLESHQLPAERSELDADEVVRAVARLGPVDAVGHRIVHGGSTFTGPVRIDAEVVRRVTELKELAPLHQAKSLAALEAVSSALGEVPAVACFDTAFHATLPESANTYAVPLEWRERWGLRRYGFHGLAHASVARGASEVLGRPLEGLRLVTCQLGGGASLAAIRDGRSVDTTMGFTPLEGLVMATRSGSIDPGLILWLLESTGLSEREIAHALENQSGVLALGGSADMQIVLEGVERGDRRAVLALAVYAHHLRAGIAAMAASMGGLDALVFSGGVGEHAPAVRSAATADLGFLGIGIDPHVNADGDGDRDLGVPEMPVRTLVVAAREDLEISRQIHQVLT